MSTDDFYAYVIITAWGRGSYFEGEGWPGHKKIFDTLPNSVRNLLDNTEEPDEDDETKWAGPLDMDAWFDLKNGWNIVPANSEPTLGMLTEYGHMWALCDNSDGMDWNIGGVTPVSYVSVYYCSQDPEVLDVIGLDDD